MDLLPSPEQLEIAETAAALLARELPTAVIRARRDEPASVEARVWGQCAEMGWFGLGLPEELGGVGYGLAEEALLFVEIGRGVAPGPFLATVLGARLAAVAGQADVAAQLMGGEAMVGLAEARDAEAVIGETVSGAFDVLDGVGAAYLLVVGPEMAALVPMPDGDAVAVRPSLDPGTRLGRVTLEAVPATATVSVADDALFIRGSVLVGAMAVGVAEATRDQSAEYAKERVQFGKPIGVHQAIKHRCADMAVLAEAARSQVLFAALSVDGARADAPFQAASAKVVAIEAAVHNAGENIQVHGGMGYTFEHDANLYLKRAHVLDHMLGASRSHLRRLVDLPAAQ